ncbi:hypothetical protein C8258_03660 [Nocardia sp. MDA0666]|uniref:hypothetical protein n=1 Tax=Nocardia sp. MDA0666 TaxID=2135448 RepID=UPI000D119CC8|nr:hypothetical protein [Nocardia sp. MDA0666]PSR70131.1 hypothetical protein C8258_03660 [Nocardia sp. MDA0666]
MPIALTLTGGAGIAAAVAVAYVTVAATYWWEMRASRPGSGADPAHDIDGEDRRGLPRIRSGHPAAAHRPGRE